MPSTPLRMLLLSIALPALLSLPAVARDWQADPARSQLAFSGHIEGEAFDGRFERFVPRIRFDPDALDRSRFDVTITLVSVDTQHDERDATLREPEFFAIASQPEARYLADRFSALGNGRFRADGTLQLNGIEQPVALEFTFERDGDRAVLTGDTVLDRLAFGVGRGDWADTALIARDVQVRTRLVLEAGQ